MGRKRTATAPTKGTEYGKWIVRTKTDRKNYVFRVECECECGFIAMVSVYALKKEQSTQCISCAMRGRHDRGEFYRKYTGSRCAMDVEPVHFVKKTIKKNHQNREVTYYMGSNDAEYTIYSIAKKKSLSQDVIRKRISIYGYWSPLIFWPGRIPKIIHNKHKLFDRKYNDEGIVAGELKTRSGKVIPPLSEFERAMPLKDVKDIHHTALFAEGPPKVQPKPETRKCLKILEKFNASRGVKESGLIRLGGVI